jgi:acid phosphatase (class A)
MSNTLDGDGYYQDINTAAPTLWPLLAAQTFPPAAWDPSLQAQVILAEFAGYDWRRQLDPIIDANMWPKDWDRDFDRIQAEVNELILMRRQRAAYLEEIIAQAEDLSGYWSQMLMVNPKSHPNTWMLISAALGIGHMVGMYYKMRENRPRPVQLYPALMPVITTPAHASFPNNHMLQSGLIATLIGKACKPLSMSANRLAYRIGENRLRAGLHYRSDLNASEKLSQEIGRWIDSGDAKAPFRTLHKTIGDASGELGYPVSVARTQSPTIPRPDDVENRPSGLRPIFSYGGTTPEKGALDSDPWPSGVTQGQRINLASFCPIDLSFPRWPAQDQGALGTCVAYAAVACCEWHLHQAGTCVPALSERFLYWQLKSNEAGEQEKKEADWLSNTLPCLNDPGAGLCTRRDFPFSGAPGYPWPPGDRPPPSVISPPPSGIIQVSTWKFKKFRYYNHPGIGGAALLHRCLKDGPAAISLPVFENPNSGDGYGTNWETTEGLLHGFVATPIEGKTPDPDALWHIVCVVGFTPSSSETMGGYFVIKNSWGSRWGIDSDDPETGQMLPGVGYGIVGAAYVEYYLGELLQLELAEGA